MKKKGKFQLLKEKYQRLFDREDTSKTSVYLSCYGCLTWAYDIPSAKRSCKESIKHHEKMETELGIGTWHTEQKQAYQTLLEELNK